MVSDAETVRLLRSIDAKLGALVTIAANQHAERKPECTECAEIGRLRCATHGPVVVPGAASTPAPAGRDEWRDKCPGCDTPGQRGYWCDQCDPLAEMPRELEPDR